MECFTTEPRITFEAARLVLDAAAGHARSLGVAVRIPVADRVSHLRDEPPLLHGIVKTDWLISSAAASPYRPTARSSERSGFPAEARSRTRP